MQTRNIRVKLRDGEMGAYLAIPDKTPAGAVIATDAFDTVTLTGADVALLLTASRATAVSVCGPLPTRVVSQVAS